MWWFSLLCSIVCWGKGESKSGPPPVARGPSAEGLSNFRISPNGKIFLKSSAPFFPFSRRYYPVKQEMMINTTVNILILIVWLRYLCTAQQCTHDTGTHTHTHTHNRTWKNTFRYRTKINRCWLNSTHDIWVIIAITCFRLFVLSCYLWWKHRWHRKAGELLRK